MKTILSVLVAVILLCSSARAEENIDDLKAQINALQKRVEALESKQESQRQQEEQYDSFFSGRSSGGFDPFSQMDRLQEEMDRMMQDPFGSMQGRKSYGRMNNNVAIGANFDMKENNDGYEIVFDMSGLNKEKMDVEINEHSITVKGEYSSQDTEEKPGAYFKSQAFGTFLKTIPLPVDADTSKVDTKKEGENLVITIPKKTS